MTAAMITWYQFSVLLFTPPRLLAAILVSLALSLSACSRTAPAEARSESETVTVPVATAHRQPLSRTLVVSAEFRPYQEVELHAKVAGYVKQISVDVGDQVAKGQLLAVLEIPEMAEDLAQAVANTRRSDAEVQRAREDLARAESAHTAAHLSYARLASVVKSKPQLVAQQELDDSLSRDRVAEAQVSAAKASLTASEQQVQSSQASEKRVLSMNDYARITAPFAGRIMKRYADTGAMIQAGTASQSQAMPVVRLAQVDRLRLILPVPSSAAPIIRIGTPVEISIRDLHQVINARITRFTGSITAATRTMEAEVEMPNPGFKIEPGMVAEASITLQSIPDALVVPLQAVANAQSHPTAIVVGAGHRIEQRALTLGLESGDNVQIVTGLSDGEQVVLGNGSQLTPGQVVSPKSVKAGA